MSDDERNRSRSPSRRPDDDDFPGWDDSMTAMFDTMSDLLPNEPYHDVSMLVHKLATKGCNTILKVKSVPPELLKIYLTPEDDGPSLMLAHCIRARMEEKKKEEDPLADATKGWAKEARAQRRKRKGMDNESSDEEDSKPFNLDGCLQKYCLAGIQPDHMMKAKEIKRMAKEAAKKKKDGVVWFPDEDILQFPPHWLPPYQVPKYLDGKGMSHAKWVACYWSKAFAILASQAFSETPTVLFQELMQQFLNINKIVAEDDGQNGLTGWKYDRYVWKTLKQRADRGETSFDVKEYLTKVDHNELKAIRGGSEKNYVASAPAHADWYHGGGKAGKGRGKAKGEKGYRSGRSDGSAAPPWAESSKGGKDKKGAKGGGKSKW